MRINVRATLTLSFDTEESFVQTSEQAMEEMMEYLLSGPAVSEFDIDVETDEGNNYDGLDEAYMASLPPETRAYYEE